MFAVTCWLSSMGIKSGVWNWMETAKALALGSWRHDGCQSSWNTDGQNDMTHLRPHNDQSSRTCTGSEKNLPPQVLEIPWKQQWVHELRLPQHGNWIVGRLWMTNQQPLQLLHVPGMLCRRLTRPCHWTDSRFSGWAVYICNRSFEWCGTKDVRIRQ